MTGYKYYIIVYYIKLFYCLYNRNSFSFCKEQKAICF